MAMQKFLNDHGKKILNFTHKTLWLWITLSVATAILFLWAKPNYTQFVPPLYVVSIIWLAFLWVIARNYEKIVGNQYFYLFLSHLLFYNSIFLFSLWERFETEISVAVCISVILPVLVLFYCVKYVLLYFKIHKRRMKVIKERKFHITEEKIEGEAVFV